MLRTGGEAVVRADLCGGMQQEIHRHALSKSCWTKLLSPYKAMLRGKGVLTVEDELPGDEVMFSEHPIWESAARCLDYKLQWKRHARLPRHINIGEMRSYLRAELLAGQESSDVRVAIGGDSQVVSGAICKGRSASLPLNRELRKSVPNMLGSGVYSSPGYVRSAHNPSDDATRGKDVRQADCRLPDWWLAAVDCNYDDLDALLRDSQLDTHDIGGYSHLGDLCLKDPSIVQPELYRSRKAKQRMKVKAKLKLRKQSQKTIPHKTDSSFSFFSDDILCILQSFGEDQFIFAKDRSWPPQEPGFLDLYSGHKGYARAAVRLGAPWVLTVDILDGEQCDLLNSHVRDKIWKLLKAGVFIHLSAAPICSSFSTAITPPVRSPQEPAGIKPLRPSMKQKILDGNSHSRFLSALVSYCILHAIHYWVENPDSSYLWRQPEWLQLPRGAARRFFRVDFCRFKTRWRKRTRFLTSGRLQDVRTLCTRDHSHVLLRGRSKKHRMSMTKLAEPYPKGLCVHLAWADCADLDLLRLGETMSCRCTHRRIGEASNPGPRRRSDVRRDAGNLDDVRLIRPETEVLGLSGWTNFINWVQDTFGDDLVGSLWLAPGLMGSMLGHYGRHLFESGKALYTFRHLLVYAQRVFPGFRGHLQPAWPVVQKWEELEPVQHRRPLPYRLVQAMSALAILWGWPRIAAVILLSFHGCCRPGEILNGLRSHIVFPRDLAQSDGPLFFRICKPKPGRRGMGRVQHAKVLDDAVIIFLDRLYGDAKANTPIYPGSAGAFRTRWNRLLLSLNVPLAFEITPAGLRAGGTVHLYRQGLPITDILWCLRLKNVETLQHYLQEISTQITMYDLPLVAKQAVNVFADAFPFCLSISLH